MGHSSLLGIDKAPRRPKGTDEDALGPSDITDSGSDMQGSYGAPEADPGEPVDVTLGRDQVVAPIEGTNEESDDLDAPDIGIDQILSTEAGDAEPGIGDDGLPRRRGRHATPG